MRNARRRAETWPGFPDVLAIVALAALFVAMLASVRPLHLRDVSDALEAAREQAVQRLLAAEEALAEQRGAGERLRADLAQRETEVVDLQAARERLERSLAAAGASRQQLETDLAATQRELAQRRAASAEAERAAAAARSQAEARDGEIGALRDELRRARADAERAQAQAGQAERQRDELQRRAEETALETAERLRGNLMEAERLREDMRRRAQLAADEARQRNVELERSLGELRTQLERLRAAAAERDSALRQGEEARGEVERLRGALAERDAALRQRGDPSAEVERIRALQAERDAALRQGADARAATERLRAELAERDATLVRHIVAAADREPILEGLRRDLAAAQAQEARLTAALQESEARIRRLESDVADLRAQVAAQPPVQAAAAPRGVIGDDAAARLRAALRGQRGARVEGDRVILGAEVLFQVGQFELQQAGRDALARVAEAIVAVAPQVQAGAPWLVQVEGHTDRQPSRQRTNMELSQLRAMSVARFLAERGVPWERLSVAGFGEHHPIDRGDNDAAHARNRRIELRFATR